MENDWTSSFCTQNLKREIDRLEKEAFAREEANKAYQLHEEFKQLAEERRQAECAEQRRKEDEEKTRQEERMEQNRLQALRILEKRKEEEEDRQLLEYLKKNGF